MLNLQHARLWFWHVGVCEELLEDGRADLGDGVHLERLHELGLLAGDPPDEADLVDLAEGVDLAVPTIFHGDVLLVW